MWHERKSQGKGQAESAKSLTDLGRMKILIAGMAIRMLRGERGQ